jgi:hypothetical protein
MRLRRVLPEPVVRRLAPPLREIGRGPAFRIVSAGFVVFALAWAIFSWSTNRGAQVLVVDATFSSKACCSMEIRLNGVGSPDLPIRPGIETSYELPLQKTLLSHPRLSLTLGDTPRSWVVIHRIYVRQGSKVVSHLPAEELATFLGDSAVKDPHHGPNAYRLEKSGALLDEEHVALSTGEGPIKRTIAHIVTDPVWYFAGFVVIGTLAIALIGVGRRELLLIPAIALALEAVRLLPHLMGYVPGTNDVSQAVSFSTFVGDNKTRQRYMVFLAAVVAVAIPAVLGWWGHRREERAERPFDGAETASDGKGTAWSSRWAALAANAVPLAIIALLSAPDLRAQLAAARVQTWADNWDLNNVLSWSYLVDRGLVPMKDFFYPYGLQYLFGLSLPWGSGLMFLTMVLFWGYTVIGSWALLSRFFSGRALVVRHVVLMAFLVVFALSGFDLGGRYSAPLGVVLLFGSLRRTDSLLHWKRILFCVALLQLTLFEVAQAIYALGPILFLCVVELALSLLSERIVASLKWVAATMLTIGLPVAAAGVILSVTGELGGVVLFYRELGALNSTYAYPYPIFQWVESYRDIWSFDFWTIPLALALGSYGLFAFRGERRSGSACVVALGLLSFMVMQKQVVRPYRGPLAELTMVSSVYGLLVWAVMFWPRSRTRHWGAVAALLGAVAALSVATGAFAAGWKSLSGGPARVSSSLGAITHDEAEFSAVNRTRWEPARFASYGEWGIVRALQREPAIRSGGRFWVLGDAAAIILLSHDRWPYYFTEFYDGTPIAYQRKVLHQLRAMPPERVVFNFAPAAMSFDGVPNVVRVPLLFDWAVRHLVPERMIGDWAILRPRRRGEPIDLSWWRRRIGTTTDLGQVPRYTRLPGERDLCLAGPRCRSYLVVTPTAGVAQPPYFLIPVSVGGLQFYIRIDTAPGVDRYTVDLSRVWFWTAPPTSSPRSIAADQVPNASVTLTKRLRDPNALY